MQILAAVSRSPNRGLSIEHLELPEPRATEVLVRVVATGVCHTDLVAHDGLLPMRQPVVLGHEGAGEVVFVGSAVSAVKRGDRVVMSYEWCGACGSCVAGAMSYCHHFRPLNFAGARFGTPSMLGSQDGEVHGGFFGQSSFATHALCSERNIVKVSDDVPLRLLGPLGCGVQTGAGAVINSLQVGFGRSLAVFGAGSVGLSAVMAARLVGAAQIIAVDPVPERRALALELGATSALDAARPDVVADVLRETDGGVNFALDTSGLPAVVRQAVDVLAIRGTCGVLGAAPPDASVHVDARHLMGGGRSIRGIVEGDARSAEFIPRLVALHRRGLFPFDRLLSFYPLDRINQAFDDSRTGRVVKPVIDLPDAVEAA